MRDPRIFLELLGIFILTITIPLTIYLAQRPQQIEKQASVIPTVLTIDTSAGKPLPRIWQHVAQGGEVPIPQLPNVVEEISELSPRYIRLDHIFDAYQVVKRSTSGELLFDFTLLDKEVDAIVKAGAIPFFSLSYIPDDMQDPQNKERPVYDEWEMLVRETVAHYSGKRGKDLQNVFYEVYNEPDLFGKWNVMEYAALYEASVKGAQAAVNTWPFSIGGPALSYFDLQYIRTFLAAIDARKLPLDFVSWHVYSMDPSKIANEAAILAALLQETPFTNALKIVSEWGPFPEKNFWYDSILGASHLVATVTRSLDSIDMLFTFEIKDGKPIDQVLGGWGILRSEEAGFAKKPRYYSLLLLNTLGPLAFDVKGVNKRLYALASGSDASHLTIILTNYTFGKGSTLLPIETRLTHLLPGTYHATKTILNDEVLPSKEDGETFPVVADELRFPLELLADNIVALDIERVSAAVAVTLGESGNPSDKAAEISPKRPALVYTIPSQASASETSVSFSLRSDVPLYQTPNTTLFESSSSAALVRLITETQGFSTVLTLSVQSTNTLSLASLPLSPSELNGWHKVKLAFDNKRALLSLSLDGKVAYGVLRGTVNLGERITFGGFEGAIDNVVVSVDGKPILSDSF